MKGKGKVIAIANQKGGVGKTCVAINLSSGLAKIGRKILLIDLDAQAHATKGLGINPHKCKKTTYDLLFNENTPLEQILAKPKQQNMFSSLSIVPSNIKLSVAEGELISAIGGETALRDNLRPNIGHFDYIFIDCPPSLGLLTLNALSSCDSVLIPTQLEYFALEGIADLLRVIDTVKRKFNQKIYIEGVVCNMYDLRTNLSQEALKEVRKFFKKKVFTTLVRKNVRISEATSHGLCVMDYAPRSLGAVLYTRLTKEFIKRNE